MAVRRNRTAIYPFFTDVFTVVTKRLFNNKTYEVLLKFSNYWRGLNTFLMDKFAPGIKKSTDGERIKFIGMDLFSGIR
jgi:hypothetical protein